MTRRTGNLELFPSDWLEIHPDDAADLGIETGDVVEVRSKHGEITIEARIDERIDEGHVFTAFHFPEVRTNLLVGSSADVDTSCPEYKVIAVAVSKLGAPAPSRSAKRPRSPRLRPPALRPSPSTGTVAATVPVTVSLPV